MMNVVFKKAYHTYQSSVISVEYFYEVSIGAGSVSNLIPFTLPGFPSDKLLKVNSTLEDDQATAIQMINFAFSCQSSLYNIRLFNKNEENLIDTIDEVLTYTSMNKSFYDQDFSNYVIVNCDVPQTSQLYLYIENDVGSDPITSIQMRLLYNHLSAT